MEGQSLTERKSITYAEGSKLAPLLVLFLIRSAEVEFCCWCFVLEQSTVLKMASHFVLIAAAFSLSFSSAYGSILASEKPVYNETVALSNYNTFKNNLDSKID